MYDMAKSGFERKMKPEKKRRDHKERNNRI